MRYKIKLQTIGDMLFCLLPWSLFFFATGNLNNTLPILVLLIITILFFMKAHWVSNHSSINIVCGLLLPWLIMEYFRTTNADNMLFYGLSVIVFVIYILVINNNSFDAKQISTYNNNLIFVGIVICFIGIFMPAHETLFLDRNSVRLFNGEVCDTNFLTSFLIFPTIITCIRAYRSEKRLTKIWYMLLLIISIYMILLSGSRGAMISLLIGFLFLFIHILFSRNTKPTKKAILILLILVLVIVFMVFAEQILPASTYNRLFKENYTSSVGGSVRLDAWLALFSLMPGKWFSGYGLVGFSNFFINRFNINQDVHNTFLKCLFMFGIIGLLLLLAVFWLIAKRSFTKKRIMLLGMVFMIASVNCFISSLDKLPFWYELALMLVYSNYCDNNDTDILSIL